MAAPKTKTVEVECLWPHVHLGDERVLTKGQKAHVAPATADILVSTGACRHVG